MEDVIQHAVETSFEVANEVSRRTSSLCQQYLGDTFDESIQDIANMKTTEEKVIALQSLLISMREAIGYLAHLVTLISTNESRQGQVVENLFRELQMQQNFTYQECEHIRQDMEFMYQNRGLPTYGVIGKSQKTESNER